MSGTRRMVVGDIALGKLRGKAMSDALANQLNSQGKADTKIKKKVYGSKKK